MGYFSEVRFTTPQWRVALLVGIGFALAGLPVYMHSRDPGRQDHYSVAKQKTREDRLAWMMSDEMPSK